MTPPNRSEWYLEVEGKIEGPLSQEQILERLKTGTLQDHLKLLDAKGGATGFIVRDLMPEKGGVDPLNQLLHSFETARARNTNTTIPSEIPIQTERPKKRGVLIMTIVIIAAGALVYALNQKPTGSTESPSTSAE